MKYDFEKLLNVDYGDRPVGEVSHNRGNVALWLALYAHYYDMDAPHLYGWCVEKTGPLKGSLILVGHTPGEGGWFITLHPGWEDDFPAHIFNEFSYDDISDAVERGDIEDKCSTAALHTLYAPILTPQYRAKYGEKPKRKDLLFVPESDDFAVNPKKSKQTKKPPLTLVGDDE